MRRFHAIFRRIRSTRTRHGEHPGTIGPAISDVHYSRGTPLATWADHVDDVVVHWSVYCLVEHKCRSSGAARDLRVRRESQLHGELLVVVDRHGQRRTSGSGENLNIPRTVVPTRSPTAAPDLWTRRESQRAGGFGLHHARAQRQTFGSGENLNSGGGKEHAQGLKQRRTSGSGENLNHSSITAPATLNAAPDLRVRRESQLGRTRPVPHHRRCSAGPPGPARISTSSR